MNTTEPRSPALRSAILAKQIFDATDGALPPDVVTAHAGYIVNTTSPHAAVAAKPRHRYFASIRTAAKPGVTITCPNGKCGATGPLDPATKLPGVVHCAQCGAEFQVDADGVPTGKATLPSLAASIRLNRAVREMQARDPRLSYQQAAILITRKSVAS